MQLHRYKIPIINSLAKLCSVALVVAILLSCAKNEQIETNQINNNDTIMNNSMLHKVRITIGNEFLTATMTDNATTRDFLTMLPLTLKLED